MTLRYTHKPHRNLGKLIKPEEPDMYDPEEMNKTWESHRDAREAEARKGIGGGKKYGEK